ncbi:MAG: DUF362 domain-containing protein [Bacilli bacterium]
MKSKVYFTSLITPESLLALYKKLDIDLKGRVACKVHSGEEGNQNYLHPEFFKPVIDLVNGTVVECNTAYEGSRNTTERHLQTLKDHGWSKYFKTEILDAVQPDMVLDIPEGKVIKKDYIGQGFKDFDSLLVLSHFKGHPMGGFGGALKQLSIGCASAYGKAFIHGAGDAKLCFKGDHDGFLLAMADSASAVSKMYEGKAAYINVMKNMSVDCDCCSVAEDPCMKDIGILASLDPIAIDQACIDLVYASKDKGRDHLVERIESRNGLLTLKAAAELGFGNREYELINVD